MENTNNYYCYFLISHKSNRTYIGITNNLENRIKQHNGKIKGGAKSTQSSSWNYHTVIGNFKNKSESMSFEWYWKHIKNKNGKWIKNKSGMNNKMKRLLELILNCKWKHVNIVSNNVINAI